ncbi:MAG TPA: hypothetical protein P5069_03540 [Candidatus Hydrogenedentes bacterium]|nr:hypothetical protein [Candidatus Hydrogenedentota bacterium]HRZ81504.1 hypothetical protein [Candidatus Hydrogenedentota bacterium]
MQTGLVAAIVGLVVLVDAVVLFWVFRRSGFFQRMTVEAAVQPERWIAFVKGSPAYVGVLRDMAPVEIMLREHHGITPEAGFSLYLDDMAETLGPKEMQKVSRKLTGCVLSESDAARIPPETKGFWLARLPETTALEVRYPRTDGRFAALAGFRAVTALLRRMKSEGLPFRAVMETWRTCPPEIHCACLLGIPREDIEALYDACK